MKLLGFGMTEKKRFGEVERRLYELGDQIGYWRAGMFTHPEDFEKYIDRTLKVAPKELKKPIGNLKSTAMEIYNFNKNGKETMDALLIRFAAQMKQVEEILKNKVKTGWDGVYLKTQRSLSDSPLKKLEYENFENRIEVLAGVLEILS